MTVANVLSQLKAKSLGPGKYFDGQGLMLVKSKKEAGKWMLRLTIAGKRREMGLGRWPDVTISEARQRAAEARKSVRDGIDPISERQAQRRRSKRLTVEQAIEQCFVARQAELKNDGQAEVKETALGHQVGNEVERAYQRSDLLEKRRALLAKWAAFLTRPSSTS